MRVTWERHGTILGHFGVTRRHIGATSGSLWSTFKVALDHFGIMWELHGEALGQFGATWRHFGPLGDHFGALLGHLGFTLDDFGSYFGALGTYLGAKWGNFSIT